MSSVEQRAPPATSSPMPSRAFAAARDAPSRTSQQLRLRRRTARRPARSARRAPAPPPGAAARHGSGSTRWRSSRPGSARARCRRASCARASSGRSSSSATICASAVLRPVPRSTWPLSALTLPSSQTASSTSGAFGRIARDQRRLAGAGGGRAAASRARTSSTPIARCTEVGAARAAASARARRAWRRPSAMRSNPRRAHRRQDLEVRAAAAQVVRQLARGCAPRSGARLARQQRRRSASPCR